MIIFFEDILIIEEKREKKQEKRKGQTDGPTLQREDEVRKHEALKH